MEKLITSTKAFQNSTPAIQEMVLSTSVIGIFENAYNCFMNGYTYTEWEKSSCAGATTKKIVREFFAEK